MNDDDWSRKTLRDIALEGIKERRRARRWGIFFKLLVVAYVASMSLIAFLPNGLFAGDTASEPHAAVVRLEGRIMANSPASASKILEAIESALSAKNTHGVILQINSPGGSPVQSGQIYRGINALRAEFPDKSIVSVAQDVMASGAYYVAAATEEISVDPASLVGSIGVITRSFGFAEALDRLGIERRVYHSGEQKSGLDPFMPEDPQTIAELEVMLDHVQQQFIDAVQAGRGERLNGSEEMLFSGRTWTGQQAVELGLADTFGSTEEVALRTFGTAKIVDYTAPRPLFDRLVERIGVSLQMGAFSSVVTVE